MKSKKGMTRRMEIEINRKGTPHGETSRKTRLIRSTARASSPNLSWIWWPEVRVWAPVCSHGYQPSWASKAGWDHSLLACMPVTSKKFRNFETCSFPLLHPSHSLLRDELHALFPSKEGPAHCSRRRNSTGSLAQKDDPCKAFGVIALLPSVSTTAYIPPWL
ncbi:hypothetical protein O181_004593 [Austropuccinia psidii MF-1]|uniref:Uncharacterized protein n=1 Tax=Austropuccinia psidii MF-1 TaxID=1389203 RepID=A0A9Q3BGX2_9BASI|nr:hypothetical protein [Austropuccinia psidii MF-1]